MSAGKLPRYVNEAYLVVFGRVGLLARLGLRASLVGGGPLFTCEVLHAWRRALHPHVDLITGSHLSISRELRAQVLLMQAFPRAQVPA